MKSGIYCIKSISQNKIYIGQSVYIKRRLSDHKRALINGKHSNEILQRHFEKYGMNDLTFDVIEFCEVEKLDKRERYWIDYYDSMNRSKGFNMESGGNEGKEFSEERKQAITREGNPMFGKKHSQEFVNYMRIHNRASSDKLTIQDVTDIKQRLINLEKQGELAKEYKVKIATINKIAKCKNWEWVLPELNDGLIKLSDVCKAKRNEEFKRLFSEGIPVDKISKITGCEFDTIKKVLEKEIKAKKNAWESVKKSVLEDYKKGLNRKEIIKKYDIGQSTYVRIVSNEFNAEKEILKQKIISLKKSGVLNKDIAETLNIHRTTVTEYLKKYAPEYLAK